jgi:tungstate transport system ATP-binding protein
MNQATRPSLLRLIDAAVRFDEVKALAALSLTVHQGEFIALVGANGSGKTSLLRLLHGLLPHTGRREVDDVVTRQAMVFQKPFFLHLSALNNVRIALWLAGVPRAERTHCALQALQRVGLMEQHQRRARALSGGQQQRLALARAWAVKPQVLFLDEPTANLDPYAKNQVDLSDEHPQLGPSQAFSESGDLPGGGEAESGFADVGVFQRRRVVTRRLVPARRVDLELR